MDYVLTSGKWQYTATSGSLENNLKLHSSAPIPAPKKDQHLVRILTTALNPVDIKLAENTIISRLLVSKPATPGIDFVGHMVKPAASSSLKPDQLVFGFGAASPFAGGCLREYTAMPTVGTLALPTGVDPIDAATIGMTLLGIILSETLANYNQRYLGVAGLTAYQSILPHVKAGSRVFLNGGSGGVGCFGIQIAKNAGCHVTTCCSTANVELCKSLGADEVIDYKKESVLDALKKMKPFDHVVDNVCSDHDLYWKAHEYTTSSAIFLEVAGAPTLSYAAFSTKAKLWPSFLGGGKRKFQTIFAMPKPEQLQDLVDWMAEGKVKAVIDSKFTFEQAPNAVRRMKTGRARGKIVVEGPVDKSVSS
jgi:NADPH:quinone reductase-like Zn-dependent oxidoreductase